MKSQGTVRGEHEGSARGVRNPLTKRVLTIVVVGLLGLTGIATAQQLFLRGSVSC